MSEYDNPNLPDDGSGNPGQDGSTAPAPAEQQRPATLDDVYKTHKIEDDAQRYRQEEFKPLPVVQREDGQEIINAVNATSRAVDRMQNERNYAALRADIDSAVATVEKETGIDRDIIEGYLEVQAQKKDGRFRKVWEERHENPGRFNAAIQAAANELAEKSLSRSDPSLLANQKAMRAYQSGSSTRQTSEERGWDNLSQSDFNRKWSQLTS